jgi:hypothetical protein
MALPFAKQSTLSDADVDFVRRVIADRRVAEAKLGLVFQTMFRKHTERLAPLISVVLDRISTPVPQSVGHYQSMLGWSLANFSADTAAFAGGREPWIHQRAKLGFHSPAFPG